MRFRVDTIDTKLVSEAKNTGIFIGLADELNYPIFLRSNSLVVCDYDFNIIEDLDIEGAIISCFRVLRWRFYDVDFEGYITVFGIITEHPEGYKLMLYEVASVHDDPTFGHKAEIFISLLKKTEVESYIVESVNENELKLLDLYNPKIIYEYNIGFDELTSLTNNTSMKTRTKNFISETANYKIKKFHQKKLEYPVRLEYDQYYINIMHLSQKAFDSVFKPLAEEQSCYKTVPFNDYSIIPPCYIITKDYWQELSSSVNFDYDGEYLVFADADNYKYRIGEGYKPLCYSGSNILDNAVVCCSLYKNDEESNTCSIIYILYKKETDITILKIARSTINDANILYAIPMFGRIEYFVCNNGIHWIKDHIEDIETIDSTNIFER